MTLTVTTGQPTTDHPGSLLSLRGLDPAEQAGLVRRAREFAAGQTSAALRDRAVGVLFTKTSTRTRTAFTVGTLRLGGAPIAYGPDDLQLRTGESVADTGRILGLMLDLLVARTAGPDAELRELADAAGIPVVNAMSAHEHPTQAIGDLATVDEHVGLPGVRLLYVGEGNNTAVALAYGLAAVPGARVVFATPPGYGLPAGCLETARARAGAGAELVQVHDLAEADGDFDVVYTTRWQTTGTSKPDAAWREAFNPFRVDDALLDRWPGARFMHDLPAHRGDEVTGAVLDGDRSLAWHQARYKLFSAMAVLERAAQGRS